MKYLKKIIVQRHWWPVVIASLVVQGCTSTSETPAPTISEPTIETSDPIYPDDLMGEWCYVKKKRITRYTVKEGKLQIRSGRSGRLYEADLTCDESYKVCEGKTVRGWQTTVTETLRLDGENMKLTRSWGGAWKGKLYHFTYTRCPKW